MTRFTGKYVVLHSSTSNKLNFQYKPISLSGYVARQTTRKVFSNTIKFARTFQHKEQQLVHVIIDKTHLQHKIRKSMLKNTPPLKSPATKTANDTTKVAANRMQYNIRTQLFYGH